MTAVTVSKIVDEGAGAKTFRLALPEGTTLPFQPGQFVLAGLPDAPETHRPYSIASSPLEPDFIEITVGRLGEAEERLFGLKGGETLLISGALGAWQFRDEHRNAVLLSTGVGIAPLRSIIRYVLDKGLPNRLSLFYAERRPADILYQEELKDFARHGVFVHATLTETEGLPENELWDGPKGPVTIKDIRKNVKDFKTAAYYLCGPNAFVEALHAELADAGIPPASILAAKWGNFSCA
ncbi:MAG: FAD-binding oxidoreductase [Elusimicrobiota bacterium]